ncbi:hypothetical protein K458DRAFT_207700 [Lentithecium fluviatile CBS 122367]|uniref:Uncharacterized protein n=1 Tax=Lentithecium fluviatile CBS 122367 TaxID=1168545 RepID=A0A6G1J719_9PLEO|nr:hypothetical protein K458DRAFT_207700 [Lentithecium fluviatile CBS 122367]
MWIQSASVQLHSDGIYTLTTPTSDLILPSTGYVASDAVLQGLRHKARPSDRPACKADAHLLAMSHSLSLSGPKTRLVCARKKERAAVCPSAGFARERLASSECL